MDKRIYEFRKWLDDEIDGCKNGMLNYVEVGNYKQAQIFSHYIGELIRTQEQFDKIFNIK